MVHTPTAHQSELHWALGMCLSCTFLEMPVQATALNQRVGRGGANSCSVFSKANVNPAVSTLQRALHLSQQQRTEFVQLRRLFLSKMQGIAQQRQDIHQSLAVRCPLQSFPRTCSGA